MRGMISQLPRPRSPALRSRLCPGISAQIGRRARKELLFFTLAFHFKTYFMETTKKILNVAIAISIVLLSLSVFIYSVKDNKAIAAPQMTSDGDGFVVAGVAVGERTVVIGYNPKTRQTRQLGEFRWDKR